MAENGISPVQLDAGNATAVKSKNVSWEFHSNTATGKIPF